MNKGELIEAVAKDTKQSKTTIAAVADAIFENIQKSLKKGGKVQLVGFGSWQKKRRAARSGRNPQTGKAIKIPARNRVVFKAGQQLTDALN